MRNLTVLFNTYPVAFDCPGGGEIQLLKCEEHLKALGVRVHRYDLWAPHVREADIVHYFTVQGGSWRFCKHVSEVWKIPLVISPIVWIDDPAKYNLGEIGFQLRMADRILPNSQAECDQLSSLFSLDPSLFSPIVNGVDEIFFEPADPELFRQHFSLHEPFVLCMGNIEKRKNQLRLIEALQGTGLHLALAGQDREAEYAAQCRSTADETVHFVGKLEHKSALQRSAYAAAEVMALPSVLETPGLAALEAAAAGCRLALTSEGCTEEYFGTFAVYMNPNDTESIANGILASLRLPKSEFLSAHIRQHFTWRTAAEQLLAVYQNLLQY